LNINGQNFKSGFVSKSTNPIIFGLKEKYHGLAFCVGISEHSTCGSGWAEFRLLIDESEHVLDSKTKNLGEDASCFDNINIFGARTLTFEAISGQSESECQLSLTWANARVYEDECPYDLSKVSAGLCGCGVPDEDSDGDGVLDCVDGCPRDPEKNSAGICGCGNKDVDTDGDHLHDCLDKCPNDPHKILQGECGCSVPEHDKDGDGFPDCFDCTDGQACTDSRVCMCFEDDSSVEYDYTKRLRRNIKPEIRACRCVLEMVATTPNPNLRSNRKKIKCNTSEHSA